MLGDNAQTLLVDATRAKGPEFTMQEAMWGTWTLAQFGACDPLASQRAQLTSAQSHTWAS
jgi:hypothetical protein